MKRIWEDPAMGLVALAVILATVGAFFEVFGNISYSQNVLYLLSILILFGAGIAALVRDE